MSFSFVPVSVSCECVGCSVVCVGLFSLSFGSCVGIGCCGVLVVLWSFSSLVVLFCLVSLFSVCVCMLGLLDGVILAMNCGHMFGKSDVSMRDIRL